MPLSNVKSWLDVEDTLLVQGERQSNAIHTCPILSSQHTRNAYSLVGVLLAGEI